MTFPHLPHVNLEVPENRRNAINDPRDFLARLPDGAILDEIQRAPDLTSWLQDVIDNDRRPGRWIMTGSQNIHMLASLSQSLAGRTATLTLLPLARSEARRFPDYPRAVEEAVWMGGYPRLFDQRPLPSEWLSSYVTTYLERDVRTITNVGDLEAFGNFLAICAGRTAQLAILSAIANDCGISHTTARSWLSVLEASYLTWRLLPFSRNVNRRITRTPKLHFHDTGLACLLLGIRSPEQLRFHPLWGPLFETWVVTDIVKHRTNRGETRNLFFYRDQHGVEADLVIQGGTGFTIIEAKSGRTIANDMLAAVRRVKAQFDALRPSRAYVVYGGDDVQKWGDVTVIGWDHIDEIEWT